MAAFYGSVQSSRGEVHRLGTKKSGLAVVAASWDGSVETVLTHGPDGVTATVRLKPWHGHGVSRELFQGPVGGCEAVPE